MFLVHNNYYLKLYLEDINRKNLNTNCNLEYKVLVSIYKNNGNIQ